MPKVDDIIRRLFPDGTLSNNKRDEVPFWPPDVFALTATLVSMSGRYTDPEFTNQWSTGCYFDQAYRDRVEENGKVWRRGKPPQLVREIWQMIGAEGQQEVLGPPPSEMWWRRIVELMCTADEASSGLGFAQPGDPSLFTDYLIGQHLALSRRLPVQLKIPKSLCMAVPTGEVCVQPKTRTPQIGCTLRSLTHNLALLPPEGEIRTKWLFVPHGKELNGPFNILLVPFPFRLDGKAFYAEAESASGPARFFGIRQNWLKPPGAAELSASLVDLVTSAEREVERVHGLVVPETALDASEIEEIAVKLARGTHLELFIAGTFGKRSDLNLRSDNNVFTCVLLNQWPPQYWPQSKHHRWRLDGEQIRRYSLGDALNPAQTWWEKTALPERECAFFVFRSGASLVALVCEDLARIDPVQAALRAIGPNLVVVLLMDGPQLERRWPGRYATVLGDDPGSAVLTLTSIGMVNRSRMPGEPEHREIALWKEPSGFARELWLQRGFSGSFADTNDFMGGEFHPRFALGSQYLKALFARRCPASQPCEGTSLA